MFNLKVLSRYLICLLLITGGAQPADYQGKSRDVRLVVLVKGIAILPCESSKDEQPSAQYSWIKDNKPVLADKAGRIELNKDGSLHINDANVNDSGIYICHATSADDSREVNVTLLVLVPDEVPYFINTSFSDSTIHRTEGSSVKFRCEAKGQPTPAITWYRDEEVLSDQGIEKNPDQKAGIWSLMLKNLKPTDTGNYSCFASNQFGIVNTTFALQVLPKESHITQPFNGTRPDLSVFHPLNTTVKYGSSATFQCRVRSEAPPNIQWLKRIEDNEMAAIERDEHDIIKVQGENYRILQSSEVVQRPDGSFLNKLTISEVFEGDSGKYICLGANSMGYSFRSAYLTVLPRPRALPLGWSRSVAAYPGHPSSLLVAIPISLGVLVGILVALVVVCHRRRIDTPLPLQSSSTCRKVEVRRTSRTATTVLDNPREDTKHFSAIEIEPIKDECVAGPSGVQAEVELEDTGSVITKVHQATSSLYDGSGAVRNEV